MNTLEKVKDVLGSLEYDKKDKIFLYSNRYLYDMYENDLDFYVIQNKINTVVEKLNSIKNKKKLNEYLNLDFDDDIWNSL